MTYQVTSPDLHGIKIPYVESFFARMNIHIYENTEFGIQIIVHAILKSEFSTLTDVNGVNDY